MAPTVRPNLLYADESGQIYDHPGLLMLTRRGDELALPRPDEMTPLPPGSDVFLLPGRKAIGFDEETGEAIQLEENAVAAFVCPAYTVTGVAAYATQDEAPILPLMAYSAVGYANGRFWVAAKKVDEDRRQIFEGIPNDRIEKGAQKWLRKFPDNRLVGHLARCALTFCCPAAKNLALGRFEAPLPTSQACNARCVGCISYQPEDSGFCSPQNRIDFRPTPQEVCEIMMEHNRHEKKRPVYSFGQGCEGEPLTEAKTIAKAIAAFRAAGGEGTVNINTNASLPETIEPLAKAGLNSIRVSMNSANPALYQAYYRPAGYSGFDAVRNTVTEAKRNGLFVSLNYLFFPGVNDTEGELTMLQDFVTDLKVDFIQLRNLNLDPELYLDLAKPFVPGPSMGFTNFKKRLKKAAPWLNFGYFNPFLGGE
ncbi:pyruvate-formate lyase-activating enzyme [Desulfobaculum xiamenense]|uniref:Pyruvate-formate lyase-activating enzyme n=1 Tax=Desulfobaculum xiamenense TaxID=995050 RepID=A0A846QQJ6_9BACT|nr:radical SAM protein [Desulfobaculum xiamenense]NJB67484.1 pyruvate-formate lyase-activating enzyme [Desulfobaculum xiamenense]